MMLDFQSTEEDISAHVMHYVCCHMHLAIMLSHNVDNSSMVVLCEGHALYQTVISKLKTEGKFINQLLSLEEIPDDFEAEIGKFT